MQIYATVAVVSYLLGSIPFGYILVRLFLKTDVRTLGSGNIGATNVGRTGHKGLAIATLLLDALKGTVAVLAAAALSYGDLIGWSQLYADTRMWGLAIPPMPESLKLAIVTAALAAITGHIFPVWLRFKGGKGVATALGSFLWISPVGVLAALVCFLLTVAATRYVSLGSIVAAVAFPIGTYVWAPDFRDPASMAIISTASLLVILKHHQNIRRLIAGTENKLGAKAPLPTNPVQTEKNA